MSTHRSSRSIWAMTAPSIPTDAVAPARADVLVAGAGLAGLTTALLLARTGRRVAVVDARQVGGASTGHTTGTLNLLHGTGLAGVHARHGRGRLHSYVCASRLAQRWLADELGGRCDVIQPRPAVTYAATEEGYRRILIERDAMIAAGMRADLLRGESAEALGLPFRVRGALRLDEQWQLHPLHALAHLAAAVRDAGGTVVEHSRVSAVAVADDGVLAQAGSVGVRADHVVLATGTTGIRGHRVRAGAGPVRSLTGAYALDDSTALPEVIAISADASPRSIRTARIAGDPVLVVGGDALNPARTRSARALLADLDGEVAGWYPGATRVAWWGAHDLLPPAELPWAAPMPGGGGRVHVLSGFERWGMAASVAGAHAIVAGITGEGPAEPFDRPPHPGRRSRRAPRPGRRRAGRRGAGGQ